MTLAFRCLFLSLLPITLSAAPAAADVVACSGAIPPGVICLTGNVSDTAGGGPLVAGQVYHLSGAVTLPAGQSLTIEAGAILKFSASASFAVSGLLSCTGAVFTSVADDSAGGDTNGDDPETPPARGDWNGVVFKATSKFSTFNTSNVRFAKVGISLQAADIFLTSSTIEQCSTVALTLSGNSFPVLASCSFNDSGFALDGVPMSAIPIFAGLTASGNDQGDYVRVTNGNVSAAFNTIGPANMLNGGSPLVLATSVSVNAGQRLTLQPGLIVKVEPGLNGFDVEGELLADGVVVTSLKDDTVGGDTAKDGLTFGTPGDWSRFEFRSGSDASILKDTLIRFGGLAPGAPFTGPAIDLTLADVTLEGTDVVECSGDALRVNSGSFPLVTGCSFSDNLGKAVVRAPIDAVQGFTLCTAQDNALDAIEIDSGTALTLVEGFVPIVQANSLNGDGVFVIRDDVTVQPGAELDLGSGVIFKWPSSANGVLTVREKLTVTLGGVVFTVLTDDAAGGDTNKDAGATQPAPGDWVGIVFTPGSDASVLDGVNVRFAGDAGLTPAAVIVSGSNPTITNSIVERSESAALSLLSFDAFPTVSGCLFRDNDLAVVGVPIASVPGFTSNTATGNTNGDFLRITTGLVPVPPGPEAAAPLAGLAIGPSNAPLPASVLVVATDVTVPPGAALQLLPGTVLKWDGNRDLDVDGCVTVGGIGNTVVLTSVDDDSTGGDTRNDGFTEGSPGDWGQIHISASGSSLEDLVVRFAGAGGDDAVRLVNADTAVKDVRVEDCAGAALALPGSSPVVDGCSFDRNILAVDEASIRALPGFSNNTAQDNTVGDYIRVTDGIVTFDLLLQTEQSLGGGPLVFATSVNVLAGNELTLDPGLVIKFEGNRAVNVNGTLSTNASLGTIIFTTLFDDIAGDTNKDMGATSPTPGLWTGLVFLGEGSQLVGGRVRFAGSFGNPALRCFADDLLVLDTLVESSGGDGLRLSSNSRPQVRRTHFSDGVGLPVNFAPLASLFGFTDNTASGNAPGDYIRIVSTTLAGQVVVAAENSLNCDGVFVVDNSVTVGAGSTLELRQGTVFKWQGNRSLTVGSGALVVEGTGLEPVVLTSVHDDAIAGDTQNNGATAAPAAGDWNSLLIGSGAGPSTLENLVLRYGGSINAAFDNSSSQLTARALRADYSNADGLRASALLGDAPNWIAFQCAGDGVDLAGGAYDVIHATVTGCGGPGLRKGASHFGALRNSISFGNAGGELSGFAVADVYSSDVGPTFAGLNGNLSADPLFTSPATGDLSLQASSPCIDTAELTWAQLIVKDHREASRVLDHDLNGVLGGDMGAFERAAYELTFGGKPKVGTPMAFTAQGTTPGVAVYRIGLLGGSTYDDPFGFTLYGTKPAGVVFAAAPTGEPVVLDVPHGSTSVGIAFGVQALVRPVTLAATNGGGRSPMTAGTAASLASKRPTPGSGTDRAAQKSPPSSAGIGPGAAGGRTLRLPLANVGNHTNLYRGRVLP